MFFPEEMLKFALRIIGYSLKKETDMKPSFHKTILTFVLMLFTATLAAATPEDGKVYRLISHMYPTLAMTEDISTAGIVTRDIGDDSAFEQMWRFDASDGGFTLTNLLTQRAISRYGNTENQYWTGTEAHVFQVTDAGGGYWNVRHSASMGGLHSAWTGRVVYWHDNAADATQWKLEEITKISEEELSISRLNFQHYADLTTHESDYNQALQAFFTDESCSELRDTYASMSDDNLRTAMSALPEEFCAMALKIKNNTWAQREREFRIRSYSAYSDPDYWYQVLYTTRWGRINNPTGIYGHAGEVIYVFVGDDIPSGATLQLEYIRSTDTQGSAVSLHKGLNVLTVADDESSFFIQYVGATSPDDSRLITDYPPIRIHIENGTVNGFWNIDEHTDADWADMLAHATAPVMEVKGHKAMFHMHTSVFRKLCPTGIHDAIDWWEEMLTWQHELMGIEDYVPHKCNNMACAITLDDDHTYMAATWYRTQFHVDVAYKVLNLSTVMTDPDYCFGPAHENGHMNQGAINFAGGTESTNSILANLIVYKLGKYLVRGPANAMAFGQYAEGLPWVKRDDQTIIRMQWQLYLYFHICGVDPTFYPRLFKAMRATPLAIRWSGKNSVKASEDILLFARNCCDVAQLDLSDFFAVYGCLVPHETTETRESNTYLTTTQKEIDAFLAHAHQYPKAQPIEFIDDRIKGMPRMDGGEGFRLVYDLGVGQCGDVGQYTDFMDTSVKAEGYVWSRNGSTITIKEGTGAVGFRLYDKADGRMIYLSNSQKFSLPTSLRNTVFRIVAVQADGTEVDVPSTAEAGTEEEQLAALTASLSSAKAVLDKKDDEGIHVGWYYGYALADLQAVYDAALAAKQQADQTAATYGQWAMQLDDVLSQTLAQDGITIPLYPENTYALYEANFRNYTLDYQTTGLKATQKDPATSPQKQWQFVPAEGDTYYIQNADNGYYITLCKAGGRVKAESADVSKAIKFRIIAFTGGYFNIQCDGSDVCLSYNSGKEAVGATSGVLSWTFVTMANHHAEALTAHHNSYLRRASFMREELENEACVTRSDDFEALRGQFLSALTTLESQWGAGNPDTQLDNLWTAMEALSPAFCTNVQPELSTDEQTVWYYLQNLKTNAYACYDPVTASGRYAGCIRTAPLSDPDDTSFYFAFRADAESGQLYIVHATGGTAGLSGSYISVDGSKPATTFSLVFNDEAKAFDLLNDEGCWTVQTTANGYAQFRTNGTQWKFSKAAVTEGNAVHPILSDDNVTVPTANDTLYDLQGRPVSTGDAVRGLYIVNGRKLYIR